jgi:hypothetical protein
MVFTSCVQRTVFRPSDLLATFLLLMLCHIVTAATVLLNPYPHLPMLTLVTKGCASALCGVFNWGGSNHFECWLDSHVTTLSLNASLTFFAAGLPRLQKAALSRSAVYLSNSHLRWSAALGHVHLSCSTCKISQTYIMLCVTCLLQVCQGYRGPHLLCVVLEYLAPEVVGGTGDAHILLYMQDITDLHNALRDMLAAGLPRLQQAALSRSAVCQNT